MFFRSGECLLRAALPKGMKPNTPPLYNKILVFGTNKAGFG